MTRTKIDIVLKYMTPEVRIIFGRSKALKIIKNIIPRFYIYRLGTLRLQVLPPSLTLCPLPPNFWIFRRFVLRHKSRMTGRSELIILIYFLMSHISGNWEGMFS